MKMLANNVALFVHLYNMFIMCKNVGQHFGYLIRDEIISNAFEDIAYNKLISFILSGTSHITRILVN